MSFILCRFTGNTAMTRVWRSFGLQETDLLALLEVNVQSSTDYNDRIQIASTCRPFSIVFHVHRELVGAAFYPNCIAN